MASKLFMKHYFIANIELYNFVRSGRFPDLRVDNGILDPVYKVVYICIDGGQSFIMAGHNALDYKLPFI